MLTSNPQKDTNNKFSTKRFLIMVAAIILTAVVVFFIFWWQLTQIINTQKEEISSLENQIKLLSEKIKNYPNE